MNYRLDADERIGQTSVLVIRREGRYTRWLAEEPELAEGETTTVRVVTQRHGVTLFAWNRGAVLEDRVMDHVVDVGGRSDPRVGTTNQIVTRLVRSCPDSLARSIAAFGGRG
jgi:hypothetical protein